MLRQTAVHAELRRLSIAAIGDTKLVRGEFTLPILLDAYSPQIATRPVTGTAYLDLPRSDLQLARVIDLERYYDRFTAQLAAYCQISKLGRHIEWTLVTGYYMAFFAAQTLLSLVGRASRDLPRTGPLRRGIYLTPSQASQYQGRVEVDFQGPLKGGSHVAVWKQLEQLLTELVVAAAIDKGSESVLKGMRQAVVGPPLLSALRNRINYSIDAVGATSPTLWSSLIRTVDDESTLESRLKMRTNLRDGERFELVTLGCASFSHVIYEDYLSRTTRPDLRRAEKRRQLVYTAEQGIGWIAH